MYTFTEIEQIYSSCSSKKELQLVTEAFSEVMLERDISSKKIFFIRKMERIKKRELENLKKKMMNKKTCPVCGLVKQACLHSQHNRALKTDLRVTRILWFCTGFLLAIVIVMVNLSIQ